MPQTNKKQNAQRRRNARQNRANGRGGTILNTPGRSSIASAPAAIAVRNPQSRFRISKGSRADSITVHGSDYIGSITTPGFAITAGAVLRNDFISPGGPAFQGTRLAKFADLYEKYVFKHMKFRYVPVVATNTAGQIGLAFDKDYADDTPSGSTDVAVRAFMGYQNAVSGSVWSSMDLDVHLTDPQDTFYTNDTGYDGRLVYQGQLYVFAVSSYNANVPLGHLFIDYEIELFDPQLELGVSYSTLGLSGVKSTMSSDVSAAWNDIPTKVGNVGRTITDQLGNKGFRLGPGDYLIEQFMQSSVESTDWESPTVIGENDLVSTVISKVLGSLPTSDGAARIDKLSIRGGYAHVFGNLSSPTTNVINPWVRIIQSAPGLDF